MAVISSHLLISLLRELNYETRSVTYRIILFMAKQINQEFHVGFHLIVFCFFGSPCVFEIHPCYCMY